MRLYHHHSKIETWPNSGFVKVQSGPALAICNYLGEQFEVCCRADKGCRRNSTGRATKRRVWLIMFMHRKSERQQETSMDIVCGRNDNWRKRSSRPIYSGVQIVLVMLVWQPSFFTLQVTIEKNILKNIIVESPDNIIIQTKWSARCAAISFTCYIRTIHLNVNCFSFVAKRRIYRTSQSVVAKIQQGELGKHMQLTRNPPAKKIVR